MYHYQVYQQYVVKDISKMNHYQVWIKFTSVYISRTSSLSTVFNEANV